MLAGDFNMVKTFSLTGKEETQIILILLAHNI